MPSGHTDTGVARELVDIRLVLVGKLESGVSVLVLADIVGLQRCAEDREAVLHVQERVI